MANIDRNYSSLSISHTELKTSLQAGQNEVHLDRLPNDMVEDSIRVEGLGNATIIDVIYKPPNPTSAASSTAQVDSLNAIRKGIASLLSDKEIIEDKSRLLDDYSKTLSAGATDRANLEDFLDVYASEKGAMSVALSELEEKLMQAHVELRDEQNKSSRDDQGKKKAVRVTVIVMTDIEGSVELSLRYGEYSLEPLLCLPSSIS